MRKGFACGVFDLFHAGHVLMLKECRVNCDFLVVAINTANNISKTINPGKRKPVFTLQERKLIIESCKYVDLVIEYDSEIELYNILKYQQISIRFLGDDYRNKPITGDDLGIEIKYINRDHGFSTTSILERIKQGSESS